MNASQAELADLVGQICSAVGEIIVTNCQLTEGLIDDVATDTAKKKLASFRQQTAGAKAQLQKLRDAQRRKRDLTKIRDDHERQADKAEQTEGQASQRTIQLLDGHGRLIGRLKVEPSGDVLIYDSRGKLVSRELNNLTFDRTGRFRGRGKQGLVVLGQTLR
jgi:hypothetical protein